jgi:uncharacterized protein with HEPN domain
MRLEAKKHLWDIQRAGNRIVRFTAGKSFDQYASDELVRAAVERQFEIIGEALSRLLREAEDVAHEISGMRRIIAFRNRLAHGYDVVSNEAVWQIWEQHLPLLMSEVNALLALPDDE